ncbi:MAG: hypothetical protein KIT09_34615 [Bryobacteraceae bacterium]|nr:hypothetical protein [Bryobacteraceae bacterium]
MRVCLFLMLGFALSAEEGPPVEILRGELLKWDGAGAFNLRTRDHRVRECTFDANTYFTSRGSRILAADVRAGNIVELVSDRRQPAGGCYAITVYVLARVTAERFPAYREALGRQQSVLDHIFPRGRLTFSGIVLERSDSSFVLKQRTGTRKVFRLREDTHFAMDGRPADAQMLEINALVFVRGGEGYDGKLEAYHVIRGQMVNPPR